MSTLKTLAKGRIARLFQRVSSDNVIARAMGRLENERFDRAARRLIPRVVSTLTPGVVPVAAAAIQSIERTGTRVVMARLGSRDGPAVAIVLMPQTLEGARLIARQAAADRMLHASDVVGDWRGLVPEALAEGDIDGRPYLVERALTGRSAVPDAMDPAIRQRFLGVAGETISVLHERTGAVRPVDSSMVERWVSVRVASVRDSLRRSGRLGPRADALDRVDRDLRLALAGADVRVAWIHGDYWPGNLLVNDRCDVTGIVDWDRAGVDEPAAIDLLHLIVYTRAMSTKLEPGRIVRETLDEGGWSLPERELLAAVDPSSTQRSSWTRTILKLYWLRFIAESFEQTDYYARHPRWLRENLDSVLASQ